MSSQTIAIGSVILIILYGIVLFVMSHKASKDIKGSAENFFVGGRGVNYIPMLGTLLMSLMSCLVILGYPSGMYRNGIGYYAGIVGVFMAAGLYMPICFRLWLLGKKYHYITPTDFFYHRFKSKPYAVFLSIVYVFCIIPYISVQVKGVANYLATSTNGLLGYWIVVLVFLAYIGFHTVSGGNKSVTNTDAFAGYCAIGALLIMVLVYTQKYIGSTPMNEVVDTILSSENAKALQKSASYDSPLEVIGFGLAVGGCLLSWPHFMQRAFMAKSAKVMRFSSMGIALGYVVIMGCCVWFGSFVGPYAFPGLESKQAENLMSMLAVNAAPIMACVLGLAVFAFGLSTADSFCVTATSLIQNNIVVTRRDKQVSQAKWWIIGMLVAVLLVNYFQPPILTNYAYTFCTPGFAQLCPSLFLGLFWKRATKEGALAGLIAGMIGCSCTAFIHNPIPSVHVILWGLIPNFIVFIIVSLLTKPDEEAVRDIVIPLREYFAVNSKRSGFKATMVLMAVILILSYFVCPYIPSDAFIGWVPALHVIQQLCGVLWAVFAWMYYKYRICGPDGKELGELPVPEKFMTERD